MDAAAAARLVRHGGGVLGLIGALLLLLRGRVGLAATLAGMAANFAGWRTTGADGLVPRCRVGRGALRARLDRPLGDDRNAARSRQRRNERHGPGRRLCGQGAGGPVPAGAPEPARRSLLRDDPGGANLLEAYLDRRFAGWRETDQGQGQRRGSAGPGSAMTRREAYEILGLPEGASAAEIIRAHRALMKKFHPDHGGSTALAARVNQAKDVLMQRQG